MLRNTDPDAAPCPVVWPIEHSLEELAVMAGDALIAQYARPRHTCKLPAGHVGWSTGVQRTAAPGQPIPPADVQPHTCHCGAWLPVRDVEGNL